MTSNEGFLDLDIEVPDSNVPKQLITKDVRSEFGKEPDIILDPSIVRSSVTPEELTQAVQSVYEGEVVDDKKEK